MQRGWVVTLAKISIMFSISNKEQNGFDMIVLQDHDSQASIEILPACGAMLHAFNVLHGDATINVIDNYSSRAAFDNELEAGGFRGSKLSPFVCRLHKGRYHFGKADYTIGKFYLGENAIHGLIYDKPFSFIQSGISDQFAFIEMRYDYAADDAGYPFYYQCIVRYELATLHSVTVTTTVINKSAGLIPVCDGWHPYFYFGGSINDCQLEFQSLALVEFNDELIPTGNTIPFQEFGSLAKIGDRFFDHCFTVNFAECQPMLVLRDAEKGLELQVRPDRSYPYLQIYTPPHRKSIAIENLSAAPDAFNNGMGLITLQPGESKTFSTNFQVHSV